MPGDQGGLLVLGQQAPRRARPVDLLRAQQWDIGQLVAIQRATQRAADAVGHRAVQRAIAVGTAHDGRWWLRLNGTEAEFDDRPRQLGRLAVRHRAQVVRRRVGDQRIPHALACRRGGVAVRGAEDGGQARHERAGDLGARPHVAPTVAELVRQPRNDLPVRKVLVENFDRRAVPVGVNITEHRFGGRVILLGGRPFRHGQLETDREVQLLRVSGGDAQPAPLAFEDFEPRCGGPQFRSVPDDDLVHRLGHIGCHERRRELGVRSQPKHQRIDDPLDGPGQRAAVVAAEHLDAGTDRPPRPVDDGPARLGDGERRRHWSSRAHLNRIGVGFGSQQDRSWVR